jgi:hypothetical protein
MNTSLQSMRYSIAGSWPNRAQVGTCVHMYKSQDCSDFDEPGPSWSDCPMLLRDEMFAVIERHIVGR